MQTNTTPTLLQAIRQDPDTGLRWAMRDYARWCGALPAASCPARPGYRGMYRRCICGAVAQCRPAGGHRHTGAGLAHRHSTEYRHQPLPRLTAARHSAADR